MAPVISEPSPNATTATISWALPEYSLDVDSYEILLTGQTRSGLRGCPQMVTPNISETVDTMSSRLFNSLQTFIVYTIIVTAVYGNACLSTNKTFYTLSAGKWQMSVFF